MKKIIALIMAVAMILSLAACGSKPVEQPEDETIKLNIGYMPNYGSLWSVTTAIEKGYFKDAGIEVTLWEFADGPTIINAMESGTIDMGYIGHGAHKLCIQGKAKIFALSHISNGDAVIGGPNVKTLADLKGKTVGYTGGTSSEDILKNALAKAGLTMADITAMEMGAENLTTAALSGQVDAVAAWSPMSLTILDKGTDVTDICSNVDFATMASPGSWVVNPDWAAENADVIVRFNRAMFKAMDFASAATTDDAVAEEVAGYVAAITGLDVESTIAQRYDGSWLNSTQVLDMIASGKLLEYYDAQQTNFGDAAGPMKAAEFVLVDLMTSAK